MNIDSIFLKVIKNHTAGDPMNKEIIWTNLSKNNIREKLVTKGVKVSLTVIKKLLRKHGYKRRSLKKTKTIKEVEYRNEQFENISRLRDIYMSSDKNPILSMDTKKKEMIGNFYRDGKCFTKEDISVFDHDFASFAEGVIIPHGIYDLKRNTGFISIGLSKDTSEFACDSIRQWWYSEGKKFYPHAESILILCDGGGSNSSRYYLFKEDLIRLANELGIEIRIAHYPPYTSKYNPIEHRLFPHVTKACQGIVFKSVEIVKDLINSTSTKTGLSVVVNVIKKIYKTGRSVTEEFKKTIMQNTQIKFHKTLPKLNYSVLPNIF